MWWSSWVVLLALAALAACDAPVTSIDAVDAGPESPPPDAGTDAAHPVTSPDAPTLTIRAATREYDLAGIRVVPIDTRAWRASVVQNGVILARATGDTEGLVRGLPAPPGERTVIIERPDRALSDVVVVVGTSTTIDLIDAVPRRDTPAAPSNTGLVLDVCGLRPWQHTDRLLLFSSADPDAAIDLSILPYWDQCITPGSLA